MTIKVMPRWDGRTEWQLNVYDDTNTSATLPSWGYSGGSWMERPIVFQADKKIFAAGWNKDGAYGTDTNDNIIMVCIDADLGDVSWEIIYRISGQIIYPYGGYDGYGDFTDHGMDMHPDQPGTLCLVFGDSNTNTPTNAGFLLIDTADGSVDYEIKNTQLSTCCLMNSIGDIYSLGGSGTTHNVSLIDASAGTPYQSFVFQKTIDQADGSVASSPHYSRHTGGGVVLSDDTVVTITETDGTLSDNPIVVKIGTDGVIDAKTTLNTTTAGSNGTAQYIDKDADDNVYVFFKRTDRIVCKLNSSLVPQWYTEISSDPKGLVVSPDGSCVYLTFEAYGGGADSPTILGLNTSDGTKRFENTWSVNSNPTNYNQFVNSFVAKGWGNYVLLCGWMAYNTPTTGSMGVSLLKLKQENFEDVGNFGDLSSAASTTITVTTGLTDDSSNPTLTLSNTSYSLSDYASILTSTLDTANAEDLTSL